MIMILCIDFVAARKSAQGLRKGGVRTVLGYHNFEQPPYNVYIDTRLYTIHIDYIYAHIVLVLSLTPAKIQEGPNHG